MATVASPCTKICIIEPVRGWCLGCGRNLVEIERWAAFSDDERARVVSGLAQRLAAISLPRPAHAHSRKNQVL
ncbi:MAG: uncharacterized protein QOF19_3499 [Alphaproteobacteria bacterium]|jgi:predicted Fe-S protein YdhL (DUF1289 family)|nr:uncharacterized protein [Alphaproteobacteria bacterium]